MGKQEAVTLFRCDNPERYQHEGDDPSGIAVVRDDLGDTPDGWLEVWGLVEDGPLTFCSVDCAVRALREGRDNGTWSRVERCEDCHDPLEPELRGQGFGCCTDCMAKSEANLRPEPAGA